MASWKDLLSKSNPWIKAGMGVLSMAENVLNLREQKRQINLQQSTLEDSIVQSEDIGKQQKEINLSSMQSSIMDIAQQGLASEGRLEALMAERGVEDERYSNILEANVEGNISSIKETIRLQNEEIDRQLEGYKTKTQKELDILQEQKPDAWDYLKAGIKSIKDLW